MKMRETGKISPQSKETRFVMIFKYIKKKREKHFKRIK